jgi:hypothetical protein
LEDTVLRDGIIKRKPLTPSLQYMVVPINFNDDIVTFTADTEGSLWIHNANNGLLNTG